MRGKRAKQIRKLVYGDYSPRFRKYEGFMWESGSTSVVADKRRRVYQAIKRLYYKNRGLVLKGIALGRLPEEVEAKLKG